MFLVQIMKKSLIFHGMNDLSTFVSLHTLQIKLTISLENQGTGIVEFNPTIRGGLKPP